MCVHALEGGHTHIAVLEGRSLVEHTLATPEGADSIDGNIYLGRVQNVLPGMEAAFVDIGTPKNGVLYRGDVAFDKSDIEGGGKPKIERMLKNGQIIMVQVTKNPIAHKGARLTQEVSLAGRFLVMVPGEPETYGISKRLPDDERKRLRRILDGLRPDDAGLIVRTAAEGATQEELERDVRRLRSQWEQISQLADKTKSAKLLYQEPDLVLRLIREEFTKEYRGVVIDDRALYEETRGYVEAIAPELAERIEYYDREDEGIPIFERFHIHEQLVKALDRKVWLPSGRLARDRAHRGAHRHRRQHRQERRQDQPRGDGVPQQPRSGRGDRPAAAPARHRRDHRHRLHRHGDQGQPRRDHAASSATRWPATRPARRRSRCRSSAWSR